jgi:hypothetical protein
MTHPWTECSEVPQRPRKLFGNWVKAWRCPICNLKGNRKAFIAECNGTTIRKRKVTK